MVACKPLGDGVAYLPQTPWCFGSTLHAVYSVVGLVWAFETLQ